MSDQRFPVYALMQGHLQRQDEPGGRWTLLSTAENRQLLDHVAGVDLSTDDPRPTTDAPFKGDIFHHPV